MQRERILIFADAHLCGAVRAEKRVDQCARICVRGKPENHVPMARMGSRRRYLKKAISAITA